MCMHHSFIFADATMRATFPIMTVLVLLFPADLKTFDTDPSKAPGAALARTQDTYPAKIYEANISDADPAKFLTQKKTTSIPCSLWGQVRAASFNRLLEEEDLEL